VSLRRGAVVLALSMFFPTVAAAQAAAQASVPRPRAEGRIDYLGRNPDAVHAGFGLNVPLATYVRIGIVAAGGPSWDDGRSGSSARADVIARFAFDPFRERRWGVSAGGGLSVRYDELSPSENRWRALIAVVLDLEGAVIGSVTPAVQLGLGGGTRVGFILRAADRFRR
jgi:hypothetical protein